MDRYLAAVYRPPVGELLSRADSYWHKGILAQGHTTPPRLLREPRLAKVAGGSGQANNGPQLPTARRNGQGSPGGSRAPRGARAAIMQACRTDSAC